ncbi:unnamed protein product [Lepidochelys olivacea]
MVLVANGAEGELEVNPAALEILRGVAQLVVVVAIVGLYHTGFSLGATIQSHTKGIWMWCLPVTASPGDALELIPMKPGRTLGKSPLGEQPVCRTHGSPGFHLPGSDLGAFSLLCPSVRFPQRVRSGGVLGKPEGPAPQLRSQTGLSASQ